MRTYTLPAKGTVPKNMLEASGSFAVGYLTPLDHLLEWLCGKGTKDKNSLGYNYHNT